MANFKAPLQMVRVWTAFFGPRYWAYRAPAKEKKILIIILPLLSIALLLLLIVSYYTRTLELAWIAGLNLFQGTAREVKNTSKLISHFNGHACVLMKTRQTFWKYIFLFGGIRWPLFYIKHFTVLIIIFAQWKHTVLNM